MQLEDALEPIGTRAAGPQPEVAANHMRRGPEGVTLNASSGMVGSGLGCSRCGVDRSSVVEQQAVRFEFVHTNHVIEAASHPRLGAAPAARFERRR